MSEEGPWKPLKAWSATADETIQLSVHYAAEYKLVRFVRWRFTPATGAGEVSFRMRYQTRGRAAARARRPDVGGGIVMWKEFVQDGATVSFGGAGEVIQPGPTGSTTGIAGWVRVGED